MAFWSIKKLACDHGYHKWTKIYGPRDGIDHDVIKLHLIGWECERCALRIDVPPSVYKLVA